MKEVKLLNKLFNHFVYDLFLVLLKEKTLKNKPLTLGDMFNLFQNNINKLPLNQSQYNYFLQHFIFPVLKLIDKYGTDRIPSGYNLNPFSIEIS